MAYQIATSGIITDEQRKAKERAQVASLPPQVVPAGVKIDERSGAMIQDNGNGAVSISNTGVPLAPEAPARTPVSTYQPGPAEQRINEANQMKSSASYVTPGSAIDIARNQDIADKQAESAYLARTAPVAGRIPVTEAQALKNFDPANNSRAISPVTNAGTQTVAKVGDVPVKNMDQLRAMSGDAGPMTAPVVSNPVVTAPVVQQPTTTGQAIPASSVTTPAVKAPATQESIMRDTFNALQGQKLNVAGPGHKGNAADQKIFDAEYARRAAEVGLAPTMTRSTMSSKATNHPEVVPPGVIKKEIPAAPAIASTLASNGAGGPGGQDTTAKTGQPAAVAEKKSGLTPEETRTIEAQTGKHGIPTQVKSLLATGRAEDRKMALDVIAKQGPEMQTTLRRLNEGAAKTKEELAAEDDIYHNKRDEQMKQLSPTQRYEAMKNTRYAPHKALLGDRTDDFSPSVVAAKEAKENAAWREEQKALQAKNALAALQKDARGR
jgi:hypothetical protein